MCKNLYSLTITKYYNYYINLSNNLYIVSDIAIYQNLIFVWLLSHRSYWIFHKIYFTILTFSNSSLYYFYSITFIYRHTSKYAFVLFYETTKLRWIISQRAQWAFVGRVGAFAPRGIISDAVTYSPNYDVIVIRRVIWN